MSDMNERSTPAPGFRIGPLANLPVFFKLDNKRVVLVGGDEPALWKAELLAASGALVEVFAENFEAGFQGLAKSPGNGQILLFNRRWTPEDLIEAALAVGSFSGESEAAEFASAAHAAGVPVNVVDRPAFCDFQFGAIVNRSPLVVGISTDGAAPVFGQAVRSLIEALLPESFRLWAAAARDLRRNGDYLGESPGEKRRFWRRFTDFAITHSERGPSEADLERFAEGAPASDVREPVTLIHIRKDPDALTLGAIRALRMADDIFFDEGIPAAVLDFARREARRHAVPAARATRQQLRDDLFESSGEGRRVVRLRLVSGPDNGCGPDEAETLRAGGLSVVVIPGVSAP